MRGVAFHHQRKRQADSPAPRQEHLMLDIAMLALGLGFFAISVGYAYACERL
jgi:hypothetical protein